MNEQTQAENARQRNETHSGTEDGKKIGSAMCFEKLRSLKAIRTKNFKGKGYTDNLIIIKSALT